MKKLLLLGEYDTSFSPPLFYEDFIVFCEKEDVDFIIQAYIGEKLYN